MVYIGCYAVGHDVVHPGMHLFVDQPAFHCLVYHRVGHGVGEMFLQAGSNAQQLFLSHVIEYHHIRHLGPGLCQGSCLVKDNGVGSSHCLHVLAALYRNMVAAGLPHGREHGQGHGQLQCAGEIHHQNGQGFCHIAGQQPRKDGSAQTPGNQRVRQGGCLSLSRGLKLLRLLNHGHNPFKPGVACRLPDPKGNLSLFNGCSRVHVGAFPLPDRR